VHPVGAVSASGRLPDLVDVRDQAAVDQVPVARLFSLLDPLAVGRLGDAQKLRVAADDRVIDRAPVAFTTGDRLLSRRIQIQPNTGSRGLAKAFVKMHQIAKRSVVNPSDPAGIVRHGYDAVSHLDRRADGRR
jgi:hypothetical protein